MKQIILLFLAGTILLILFYTYAGIGFEREWSNSTFFMKHKPKVQLFFRSTVGESDRAKTKDDLIYEEYFERNSKKGLYTIIVYIFLQTGLLFLIIPSHLLAFKIKKAKIDIKKVLLFILYGILIKLMLYVFAWNIWGLNSEFSYLPLILVMIAIDYYIFWIQKDSIILKIEEKK